MHRTTGLPSRFYGVRAPLVAWLLLGACTGKGTDAAGDGPSGDSGESHTSDTHTSDSDSGEAEDSGGVAPGHYFPGGAPWYTDVHDAHVDTTSDDVIRWLDARGWGLGHMQIDFSMEVLDTDGTAPFRSFTPNRGYFYSPDCDQAKVPIPEGGAIEGESGYACASGGDCHLIVPDWSAMKLYEMWKADIRADNFSGGCLAVWDMTRVYGPEGRGEQCTSADAAGFPIAPLLFSADEVAAGEIDHAIRFILPNEEMRAGVFVAPATHAGGPSADSPAPPYGVHLRLRDDYPLDTLPNDGARTIARAMQTYGMFLADGGNVALTARSDRFTEHKWRDLIDSHALEDIQPSDFEVLDMGAEIPLTYECVRTH